ncbi:hypothetical protein QW131_16990 [Roseibium salinum]|nr:hypothetical protein [Roseibium salinum]
MLPLGLMTDVSAGALAAGSGALQGAGQGAAVAGQGGEHLDRLCAGAGCSCRRPGPPETPPADAPAARSGKSLEALLKKDEMPLAALLPMITDISPGQVFQAGGPVPGTKFATASVQDGSLADLLASLGLSGSAPPDAEAGEELPVPDLGEGGDIPADGAAGELAGQEGETELPVDLPVDDGVVQLPVPGPVMGEAPGSVDPAAPADGAVSSGGSEEGPEQVVAPLDPQLVAGQASDAAMPPAPAVPPVDAPPRSAF